MANSKALTLKHSVFYTFLGTGAWSLCNWLMATVLAKLGTPVKLGQYTLANVVSGPIFMFSYLGLRALMVTDTVRRFPFRDYFSLRLLTSTLALVLVSAFAFHQYRLSSALVVLVVAAGMWFDSISDVIYAIFQENDRADCVGRSMGLKGVLSLAMLAAGMLLTKNVIWAAAGSSLASLIIVAFYDSPTGYFLLKNRTQQAGKISNVSILSLITFKSLPLLGKVALVAMPLGFMTLFASITGNVPQYFIESHLGERSLGLYSAIAYLINVGRIGVMATGNAAIPYLARAYSADKYTDYRNMVLKLMGVGLVLAISAPILASVVGRKAVTILYTSEYAQQTNLIVLILLAGGLRYMTSLVGYCITAARSYNVQVAWFGFTFVVAVISSWWFVPRMGLEGAAISAGITAGTDVIVGLCVLLNVLGKLRKRAAVPPSLPTDASALETAAS